MPIPRFNYKTRDRVWQLRGIRGDLILLISGNRILHADRVDHFKIQNVADNKNIRINSRDYTAGSGGSTAVQIKPSVTVGTTKSMTGLEVSPRFQAGIAGSGLRGILADPVIKAGSGNISEQVVGFECNMDFGGSGTRTFAEDIAAFSTFLAIPNTNTYSKLVTVMRVRGVNIRGWDGFLNIDDDNTGATQASAVGSGGNKYLKVYIGSTLHTIAMAHA